MEKIGKRLKEIRIEKGLSKVQLSRFIGFSSNSISKWESSERKPRITTLIKFANFFNCSMDFLLGLLDE